MTITPQNTFVALVDETQRLALEHAQVMALVAQACKLASNDDERDTDDKELLEGIAALTERARDDLNTIDRHIHGLYEIAFAQWLDPKLKGVD